MIAAIRIKGTIGIDKPIENTLRLLHLHKKNYCSILEENKIIEGMLAKVKDYITWGEIEQETIKLLEQKSKKQFIRLNSPRKGYGRKGIKKSFSVGGALGYRKEAINDLIKRML
ncbi:50S ribosomal protein L30 [Candidatus Woesearchaeota archaeon]|nr:50S ribosomal protein L30 [Candidatus Woesearchaeota archaeon]|tara:strand:+ start:20056 stop:20397 length:342 start_codon:yes stop_codon:yes gene_type:complete